MFRRLSGSELMLSFLSFLLVAQFRIIGWTTRRIDIPERFHEPFDREPVIVALWHGEHFLVPAFAGRGNTLNVLVSLHRDGEAVARAGRRFGLKFIRGSGDNGLEFMRKKAVQAFGAMLRALKTGESVVMTADVPKVSRVAGLGVVTLAKHSGCPIVPVAIATTRRIRLKNWDRTCLNMPFGRMVFARGEPIRVARDADDAAMELARRTVEQRLNEATERAYAVADGKLDVEQARAEFETPGLTSPP
jgi:lysophospholipid acyltransferase (LPLAT)-like uncharacterized protein